MPDSVFTIDLDRTATEAAVRDIEANSFFQSLIKIRELDLDDEEESLIFEIAQRKEAPLAALQHLADGRRPLYDLLNSMVKRGYLVCVPVAGGEVYRLSALLNPPRPITTQEAIEIHRQMNEAGQQGVLEAYIRKLVSTLGEEGLRVTEQIMAEKGRQVAERLPGVIGQGAGIAGLRFIELMRANGTPIDIVYLNDDEVRFRVQACAYHLTVGEEAICEAVSAFDRALIQRWGCEIEYPITIPKGAAWCEGIVRIASKQEGSGE